MKRMYNGLALLVCVIISAAYYGEATAKPKAAKKASVKQDRNEAIRQENERFGRIKDQAFDSGSGNRSWASLNWEKWLEYEREHYQNLERIYEAYQQ